MIQRARRYTNIKEAIFFSNLVRLAGGYALSQVEYYGISYAIDRFRRNGIFQKLLAYYPLLTPEGPGASKNIISASYALSFTGPFTYGNGVAGDGLTAYASGGITPALLLSVNNTTLGFFTKATTYEACNDMGMHFFDISAWGIFGATTLNSAYSNPNSFNIAIASPQGSNVCTVDGANVYGVKDGITVYTAAAAAGSFVPDELFIFGYNFFGAPSQLSSRTYLSYYIGNGLTEAQAKKINNIETTYNKTIGRL
ncbi:MAG: hypothetical protein NW207_04845 [Cytophagales bacterium]|nr:hypothetical protein [Cytophagales bacterium]